MLKNHIIEDNLLVVSPLTKKDLLVIYGLNSVTIKGMCSLKISSGVMYLRAKHKIIQKI